MTHRSPSLHVLVLDDDEKILRMFQLFTRQEKSIQVYTATSGREGLELMVKYTFDLVIADIGMPGMDGLDFTREVRKIWPWQEVFFCTGKISEALKKEALTLNVKHILEKPLSRNQLQQAIDSSRSSRAFHISEAHGIAPSNSSTMACLQKLRHVSGRVWKTPRLSVLSNVFLEFIRQSAPVDAAALLLDDGILRRYQSSFKTHMPPSVHETLYTACQERLHAITGRDWICEECEQHRQPHSSADRETVRIDSIVYLPLMGHRTLLGMLVLVPSQGIRLQPADFPLVFYAAHHLSTLFQAVSQIQQQGMKDPLTGLFNRRYLQTELERARLLTQREKCPLGLVMLDLDGFKVLNDTLGHAFGDHVLKHVANLLVETLRRSDLIVRLGGDEFVLILPQTDKTGTRNLAERLQRVLRENPIRKNEQDLAVTASMGAVICQHEASPLSSVQLLECADQAMYQAKHDGGNRLTFWEASGQLLPPAPCHEVLIVDDDQQVLNLLKRMLSRMPYNVTTVTTVAEAESLLNEGRSFELLLTDLSLPGRDGYQMLSVARKHDPDLVALVITGHLTKHSEETLKDHGAFDIISKPFHPNILRNKLHEAIEHRAFRLRSR